MKNWKEVSSKVCLVKKKKLILKLKIIIQIHNIERNIKHGKKELVQSFCGRYGKSS